MCNSNAPGTERHFLCSVKTRPRTVTIFTSMGLKVVWALAIFVLSWSSQCQGILDRITYVSLDSGEGTWTNAGRVVVQLNGEQVNGSICDSDWKNEDAAVVCRMLGYGGGSAAQVKYKAGNHNYLISNIKCTGTEGGLGDCGRDPVVNCGAQDPEVGVMCQNPTPSAVHEFKVDYFVHQRQAPPAHEDVRETTINGSCPGQEVNNRIRLHGVEGKPGMGYVQVNVDGNWQYICDDRWNEKDAEVVCRELCFYSIGLGTQVCPRPSVEFGFTPPVNDSFKIAWDNVQCNGSEDSIFKCQKTTGMSRSCAKSEIAGVQCLALQEQDARMEARLTCFNFNGDLVVNFPMEDFPGISARNLRIVNQSVCDISSITRNSANPGIDLVIPHKACGTRISVNNNTHLCYQNVVEYDNEIYKQDVLLEFKKKTFTVECCMPHEKDVSIKFVPQTAESATKIIRTFDYMPEISFYENEQCDRKITANPYSVEVGKWVYIGIKVTAESSSLFTDDDMKLVITGCTVNPVGNGTSPPNVPHMTLIENKCPADFDSVTTYPISNTTEGFRFRAFKFFGYSSVYVSCHLRVCLITDPKPQCDRSCIPAVPGRRRRRDIANNVMGLDNVISKTLYIVDPKDQQQ
ncbi:unnamed protein product [Lymnaea stagnalis]|uniref:Deleted in malignant brain tumors 1 protein-like n=1 Tax=Lymnaea stagnalis TaxID=6523 RepID=A0AAV2HV20_LYMST